MKKIVLGILIFSAFTQSTVFADDFNEILIARGDGNYPPYEMVTF